MDPVEVTVLIPCNDTRYLRDCFASINDQSLAPDRVLVVLNGAATLTSHEQIEELKLVLNCESDFHVAPGNGIVGALNYGLKFVKTKYLARLDADDLISVERLAKQVAFLESHTDYVAVGGQVVELESNKRRTPYPLDHDQVFKSLFRFSSLPHPGVTFRMSAIHVVGSYSNEFACVEDWELWIRLSRVGKLANLDLVVLRYRLHDLQITNSETSRKMVGQEKLTKARFFSSLKNFSNECGCNRCFEPKSQIFGEREPSRTILTKILKANHGVNYSASCLAGYLYVLGKKTKQKHLISGLFILACCVILRPNWAFRAFQRRLASLSTEK